MPNAPIDLLTTVTIENDQAEKLEHGLHKDLAGTEMVVSGEKQFSYETIQKAMDLNEEILLRIPQNTTIVDVGAGAKSRFTATELASKGQKLVNLDHVYVDPAFRPRDDHTAITADLSMVPEFMERTSLPTALKIIGRSAPDDLRAQVKLLTEKVQLDNLGAFVFSHSLEYLDDETTRRALTIAANNLCPDGRIFVFGKTLVRYDQHKDEDSRATSKFHLLYELLRKHPDLRLDIDSLFIPAVSAENSFELDEIGSRDPKAARAKFNEGITSGEIPLLILDGKKADNGTPYWSFGDGKIGYAADAERMMIVRKETAEERTERIEKNKDKLDLKPGVDFVADHLEKYQRGLDHLLAQEPTEAGKALAEKVICTGTEDIVDPQVSPEEGKRLLAVMPQALVELSKLEEVAYHTFGNKRVIPVPGYDKDGNFLSSKVQLVSVDEFPRPGDHPSRILVGVSNGKKIFPTPIPPTVSSNPEAVKMYQIHVFLHEFFHTVDYPRRNGDARSQVVLETDGQQFTLQDWWQEFEELILSGEEPGPISSYAETYAHQLNPATASEDPKKYTAALAEQMAETFVAYQLGIISNNQGWTNFKEESFGDREQWRQYMKGNAPAANRKWILMDKLCRAKVMANN